MTPIVVWERDPERPTGFTRLPVHEAPSFGEQPVWDQFDLAALEPSVDGDRQGTQRSEKIVRTGPFAEAKDVIGGYVVVEATAHIVANR